MEENNNKEQEKSEKPNVPKELKKISLEKIKGRIIILNPDNSEIAKNLKITEAGDYTQKK